LTLLSETGSETGSTGEAAVAQPGGTENDPSEAALPTPADGTPDKTRHRPSDEGLDEFSIPVLTTASP
jgi:hypothetical protein